MKRAVLMVLVAGMLSAGSCLTTTTKTVTIGDFCTTARPLVPKDRTTSDWISDNDPRLAEDMINQNTFGERHCDWRF